jgi:hypothetical protein
MTATTGGAAVRESEDARGSSGRLAGVCAGGLRVSVTTTVVVEIDGFAACWARADAPHDATASSTSARTKKQRARRATPDALRAINLECSDEKITITIPDQESQPIRFEK